MIHALLIIALACAPEIDTSATSATLPAEAIPVDRPDVIHHVEAGIAQTITIPGGASYTVECADPAALVAFDADGRLCSVLDGAWLDVDADGRCDLSPPVDLTVEVRW